MLRGRLSFLLLQQCAASQQQLQQCVWAAAACLSTSSASTAAAATASAAAAQAPAGNEGASSEASPQAAASPAVPAATGRQRQKQPRWARRSAKQQELRSATFEQLQKDVKQQHALQSAQAEPMLLLLISKASSEEQVAAAVAAVQANHLKRQRIRQPQPYSPAVFSALLKAGARAGLGHNFGLQLLQQTEKLGLQTSLAMCETVLASCVQQKDYAAAGLAWIYSKAHCLSSSSSKKDGTSGQSEAAGKQPHAAAAAGAAGQRQGEAWASTRLVLMYARGVAQWLQEGGVGQKHKKRLQVELQELAQELQKRGAKLPQVVEQALQEAAPAADTTAADAAADASSGGAEGEEGAAADLDLDAKEQAADDGKPPSTA